MTPSTSLTRDKSGAIVEYLIETYDKECKLTYESPKEKFLLKSWLHFQMSGQGPYFGQSVWFQRYHPNKENPVPLPSAVERYQTEAKRVIGVIERHLRKQGTGYLVGDKVTYADLAFIPWNELLSTVIGKDFNLEAEAPNVAAWHEKMKQRASVKKAYARKQKLVEEYQKSHT